MSDPRQQLLSDIGAGALRTAVPAAAWAWTLNNMVLLIGVVSGLLNVAYVIWKWRRDIRRQREIERLLAGPIAKVGDRAARDG